MKYFKEKLSSQIIKTIRNVTGPGPIALHEPRFKGNELKYLKECIDTTYVSSVGKFVDLFEESIASYTGAKNAIAVVNGTAALHIALKLSEVKANNEVLLPALTFVATANAVTYCNAIPHFVDSDLKNLGIDALKLREYLHANTYQYQGSCINKHTERVIKAIIPMHTFGHPCDLDNLLAVAHDFNIILVEDAAESLGSSYCGKQTGTFGLFGTLSFNGNKTITTGGGGAILTDNTELAKHAKHLITTAKLPHGWEYFHDEIGYNYRMPNLNAALGCAQLELLPDMIKSKRELFKKYDAVFSRLDSVNLFKEPQDCESNYWLQTLVLDDTHVNQRDEILKTTNNDGLMTRPVWKLMSELPAFQNCPSMDLDTSQSLAKKLINIPSSSFLDKDYIFNE